MAIGHQQRILVKCRPDANPPAYISDRAASLFATTKKGRQNGGLSIKFWRFQSSERLRGPDLREASPPFALSRVRSPERHSEIKIVDVVASAPRQHQTSISKVSSLNEQTFRQAPPRSSPVHPQGAQQHQERSRPHTWVRSTARPKACRRPDGSARRRRAGQAR